jgi:hypothetical protein
MIRKIIVSCLFVTLLFSARSQDALIDTLPVRGLCIEAPNPAGVDRFVKFIAEELAPLHLNTLILRVDYNYQYQSRPELANPEGLSKQDIEKLVTVCRDHNIQLIPQVNLLGHQSWASSLGKLLQVYPEFDETPEVSLPEKYEWPNEDGLYCKSYCPLHPEVHDVVFDIVDEICDVFQTDAFHAGMDEVFYLGEEQCPRCNGRDPAELFAGEVTRISNHLADNGRQLWIWGDRLIDGKMTGMGMWEASMNNTYRAVDLIPKDVMICDWHYERPDQTAVYFAMKGFPVVTCPWRNPEVARQQVADMYRFRKFATGEMKDRYQGMLHTVWTGNQAFLDQYYGLREHRNDNGLSQVECLKEVFQAIKARP